MADEIRIAVGAATDAVDLDRAFGARGLPSALNRRDGALEVVVLSARERTSVLVDEVLGALDEWLADRHLEAACVRVGDREEDMRRAASSSPPSSGVSQP